MRGRQLGDSSVVIDHWFGRFSNNLIQLVNACCIARELGLAKVIFPPSNFFDGCEVRISATPKVFREIRGRFFTFSDVTEVVPERPSYAEMRDVAQTFVRQIVTPYLETEALMSDRGVGIALHVRGGDIFSRRPQPRYVPGPMEYFKFFVAGKVEVNVVYEDLKNPVTRRLLSMRNCIDASRGEMFGDLVTLSRAKCVITGPGTYWFSAFLLGNNLKSAVVTVPPLRGGGFHDVWKLEGWPKGFKLVKNYLHDYINAGEWRNTWIQRRKILSYDFCSNVEIVTADGLGEHCV